ncbi:MULTISPECIES: phage terminase small subunit [unclassified Methylophaga]|jgi:hypothetical protein|uniref:phage terminase small subunit n=1 Tax=unclassified Methylophaga TaxID=2629249 RepID=UPI00259D21F9|nr:MULTISPECIES: phage terminase small subunit [unclassified Methylophaga]|tara:strand:+ start:15365 stop:16156 length:792 start_codon:yes stop_codon:yes gene_type:complete
MSKLRQLKQKRAEPGGEKQLSQPKTEQPISKLKAIQLKHQPDLNQETLDANQHFQTPGDGKPFKQLLEQYQAALQTDVQRLSTKDTIEDKAAMKKELLPNYMPFVEDYMANGHDYPNSVAVMMMVWLFDIGDIEQGLHLGFYLVKTPKQTMPHGFSSTMETFICDYTYDWASAQIKEEKTASPYLDNLVKVLLDAKWELAMPVKSKMLNMMAKNAFLKGEFKACVSWCEATQKVNPEGHGTKTLMSKALKEIEKLEQAQADKE